MLSHNKTCLNLSALSTKLLIFDFDGVLVDTQEITNTIQYQYFKENHLLEIDYKDFVNKFSGLRVETIIDHLKKEKDFAVSYSSEDIANIIDEKILKYLSGQPISPLPGVVEFLENCHLPKCIGSNCSRALLQEFLKASNLYRFFGENVFNAKMVQHPKPAPDLYIYAAQKMGFNRKESLVVEDSVIGVKAAYQAGIPVIGFLGGSHVSLETKERLLQAGAQTVIKDMRELNAFLMSSLLSA